MPSRDEVELLRRINSELSAAVRAELDDFLGTVSYLRPEAVRDALLQIVPGLVTEYGDAASVLAAEWFTRTYGVEPVLVDPVKREFVEKGVRFSATHLFSAAPELVATSLATKMDKWVKQPSRETIVRSAERHGLTWARVPTGEKTCAFCLILASRTAGYGAGVYHSRDLAKFRQSDDEKYHGECDCAPVVIRGPGDYPEGYDPEEMYDVYRKAAEAAGTTNDINAITYELRRQRPDLLTDGLLDHAH